MKKRFLILLLVFVLAVVLAFFNEDSYRVLVRFFFKFYQSDKIRFFGKNFHLFASPYILISFGLFSVISTAYLYRQRAQKVIFYLISAIVLFFITTMTTTYFDSLAKVVNCTDCLDGVRRVHYNDVNYDFHFLVSLLAGLFPIIWDFFKRKISNGVKHNFL